MSKKEFETIQEVENVKKTAPIKLTEASILLNSGKMGFVFIGVIVGFVMLTLLMSFIKLPSNVYIALLLLSLPFVYIYYLRLHANDEDKLD